MTRIPPALPLSKRADILQRSKKMFCFIYLFIYGIAFAGFSLECASQRGVGGGRVDLLEVLLPVEELRKRRNEFFKGGK